MARRHAGRLILRAAGQQKEAPRRNPVTFPLRPSRGRGGPWAVLAPPSWNREVTGLGRAASGEFRAVRRVWDRRWETGHTCMRSAGQHRRLTATRGSYASLTIPGPRVNRIIAERASPVDVTPNLRRRRYDPAMTRSTGADHCAPGDHHRVVRDGGRLRRVCRVACPDSGQWGRKLK